MFVDNYSVENISEVVNTIIEMMSIQMDTKKNGIILKNNLTDRQ